MGTARLSPDRRLELWADNGGLCYLCGLRVKLDRMTIDHVRPRASGGTHAPSNLMPAHRRCNLMKGSLALDQLQWRAARIAEHLGSVC